jgi:AFG3 family protein
LVDRVVVANKSVAKVYVRSTPASTNGDILDPNMHPTQVDNMNSHQGPGRYKFYFNIGSVESFEEKLEEAQEALGIDPHDYVPVTYTSEVNLLQEVIRFAPTAFFVGLLYFMGRRMQSGFNIGGGAGRGRGGIFNIGKAQVTKLDKNSKNKVSTYCFKLLHMLVCIS